MTGQNGSTLSETVGFNMKSILLKLFHTFLLIWLFLFTINIIYITAIKNKPFKTIGYCYDLYYINKNIVVASIEGSGGFVCISVYDEKNNDEIISLYQNESEDSFHKLYKLDKIVEEESILDGNYIIADFDFDNSIEICRFSEYNYEVGKNIYQINAKGKLSLEDKWLSVFLIKTSCFLRNYLSIFVLFIFILIEFLLLIIFPAPLLEYLTVGDNR